MRKHFIIFFIIIIFVLSVSGDVFGHGGRTNSEGCHTNRKTGDYHCHGGGNNKEAKTSARTEARQDAKDLTRQPIADVPAVSVAVVVRVIDGDTIEIEGGQKVRFIGIDTPETLDPRKPVQCFGVEASNYTKELVENKIIRLERDISNTDKYGRLLRYIYVGDTFVNLVLVQEGYAHSYTYPPDIKYQDQFIEAQRIAREQKKGLWGSCPVVAEEEPTTAPAPITQPSTECTIKGNISSSGEKIYHVEGCGSYNVTKIDEARGERWFCTGEEAITTGWRKAKNCP